MNDNANKKSILIEYSLYLACILSNLSQLPVFVQEGVTQRLAFPGWIILAVVLLFVSQRIPIKRNTYPVLVLTAFLFVWLLFDTLAMGNIFFSSSLLYCFLISLFVFALGSWSSEYISGRIINNIIILYVLTALWVSAAIFVRYFGADYNLATRLYAYGSKNSVSQIIFTSIILLIVRYRPTKIIMKCIRIGSIVFLLWVLLLLRSRATFVSLALCIVAISFSKSTNKRVRIAVITVSVITLIIVFTNNRINNIVINNIIYAGRNVNDLDELTSGRLGILNSFPGLIKGNWLTGIGATYFECFPLSALLQFGLLGGVLLIGFSLLPLVYGYKYRRWSDDWFLLFLLALGYSANGLFEGLTPFGPGVKCYFLWLLFGILLSKGRVFSGCTNDIKSVGESSEIYVKNSIY